MQEVSLLFDSPPPGERFATNSGRYGTSDGLEVRTRAVSSGLASYCTTIWVGRHTAGYASRELCDPSRGIHRGLTTHVVYCVVTSLEAPVGARDPLHLIPEHWPRKNQLHGVCAVTMGADTSQVCSGVSPEELASVLPSGVDRHRRSVRRRPVSTC